MAAPRDETQFMKSSEYEEKTEMLDIVSEDDVVEQKEEVISRTFHERI